MKRYCVIGAFALLCAAGLSACGATPEAAAPQTVTQVVTQIVPQTVVVTQLATVIVTATPPPATPAPPTATPLPAAGKWEVITDTAAFDDSQRVVLRLEAEADIETGYGTQRPTLVVRCQEGATEAYIVTGTPPDVEAGNLDGATVRVRFDQSAPQTLVLGKSTDDKALFFDGTAIIDQMTQHERMLFEFTPFNEPPAQTAFDLRGLLEAIVPLRAACSS